MNIESELPSDFKELSDSEKIEELREIVDGFDESNDSGILKKRMVEELISYYSKDSHIHEV